MAPFDIVEAAKHFPNFAKTRCCVCDHMWPCPTWRELRREIATSAVLPEHPFVHREHCAECAVNRPGRV